MKKFLTALVIIGIIISVSFFGKNDFLKVRQLYYYAPCKTPITYSIGTIDPRFGLSNNDVIQTAADASAIWNKVSGKLLFAYDPESKLTINMLYDKRQSLTTQATTLENTLTNEQSSLKSEIQRYEDLSRDFKNRMNRFSATVDEWNAKGGAPKEEYEKLIAEQQALKEEAERLDAMAARLNISTQAFNTQVRELKKITGSLNTMLTQKPEEGIYDPNTNRIEIYFNNNRDELVRTLAHELGHARSIDHSDDPKAIMYPTTTQYLVPVKSELDNLAEVCRVRPFYEVIITRINTVITLLIQAQQASDSAEGKSSSDRIQH